MTSVISSGGAHLLRSGETPVLDLFLHPPLELFAR